MSIIKQANNYLKNVILNEMAYSRKWTIDRLNSLSAPIIEHIIKCAVYENTTNNLNHWIEEIADYLDEANSIEVKTSASKLKEKDYLQNLFYYQGENKKDIRVQLINFRRNKNYSNYEITQELINKVTNIFQAIAIQASNILATKNNNYSKNGFINLLTNILA